MRASVESYSLKRLEPFFGFDRKVSLHEANIALTRISAGLELNDVPSIGDDTKTIVQNYNADDCYATAALREWLEDLRSQLVSQGQDIPRPAPGQEGPSEELDEQARRVQELVTRLTHDVSVDPRLVPRSNRHVGALLGGNGVASNAVARRGDEHRLVECHR